MTDLTAGSLAPCAIRSYIELLQSHKMVVSVDAL
jgi:hypothetical protein